MDAKMELKGNWNRGVEEKGDGKRVGRKMKYFQEIARKLEGGT